jgi:hypothetical protein
VVTYSPLVSTPSRSVSAETPVQTVSSFDYFVAEANPRLLECAGLSLEN